MVGHAAQLVGAFGKRDGKAARDGSEHSVTPVRGEAVREELV